MPDGVVLVGLPGSGKTTLGEALAERLDRPFVDIDREVEHLAGMPAGALIERRGEAHMRDVERAAVEAAVAIPGAVIATGGGTILDPLNRWQLMRHGRRIRLDADLGTLAQRLRADDTPRPLLGADLEAGLRRTAVERAPLYAAVDAVLDASRDVEALVETAIDALAEERAWRPLLDQEFERGHPIGPPGGRLLMGTGFDRQMLSDALDGQPVFVVDCGVPGIGERAQRTYPLQGGEQVKTVAQLERLLGWLAEQQVERSDPLVAIGGGTIGDLAGLAAALHRRGIPLVQVPTTWLAQSDAAIGGKVAVDLPAAKNGVGAFWPPALIVSDTAFLETLPLERRRDGIAECLKMGLIGDPALWQLVATRGAAALRGDDPAAAYAMSERAARLKLAIVERDPFEAGERRLLNLGHTLGHALEIESGYSLAHGAAVALGLRGVARIAARRAAQAGLAEQIDTLLDELGFELRRRFDRARVAKALLGDKKRAHGLQRWVLPLAVGEVAEVSDVTDSELADALGAISA